MDAVNNLTRISTNPQVARVDTKRDRSVVCTARSHNEYPQSSAADISFELRQLRIDAATADKSFYGGREGENWMSASTRRFNMLRTITSYAQIRI